MVFILTRYLYSKEKVMAALQYCLSQKKDEAIELAYELYFSGFEEDVWNILWKHFYLYSYIKNEDYESYFYKLEKEWKKTKDANIISQIIQDLFIRRYGYLFDIEYTKDIHLSAIYEKSVDELLAYYQTIIQEYKNTKIILINPIRRSIPNFKKEIIIARIIALQKFSSIPTSKRTFYIEIRPNEIEPFLTQQYPENSGWKLLKKVIHIDLNNFINDINENDKEKLKKISKADFEENWLYYSSFSPIWKQRIEAFSGKVNSNTKKIIFENEDEEEKFHNLYNLEPDEQPKEIQKMLDYAE